MQLTQPTNPGRLSTAFLAKNKMFGGSLPGKHNQSETPLFPLFKQKDNLSQTCNPQDKLGIKYGMFRTEKEMNQWSLDLTRKLHVEFREQVWASDGECVHL